MKYLCKRINMNFAFAEIGEGNFVGEKVILTCNDKVANGHIIGIVSEEAECIIELLCDVTGFGIDSLECEYTGEFVEVLLSPTILGRRFDSLGTPIDGDSYTIPIEIEHYSDPNLNLQTASHENTILIPNTLKLGGYTSKSLPTDQDQIEYLGTILLGLTLIKIAIVVCCLDSQRVNVDLLDEVLEKNQLQSLSVQYHSVKNNKEILFSPKLGYTTAKYLATELGFDVILVMIDFDKYKQSASTQNKLRDKLLGTEYFGEIETNFLENKSFALSGDCGSVSIIVLEGCNN